MPAGLLVEGEKFAQHTMMSAGQYSKISLNIMACSHHRHARDKAVLSCPYRWCEQAIAHRPAVLCVKLHFFTKHNRKWYWVSLYTTFVYCIQKRDYTPKHSVLFCCAECKVHTINSGGSRGGSLGSDEPPPSGRIRVWWLKTPELVVSE